MLPSLAQPALEVKIVLPLPPGVNLHAQHQYFYSLAQDCLKSCLGVCNSAESRVEYRNSGLGQAPVAHTCNPSYSGGRDQEDWSSKPAQANSFRDLILKKPFTKRAGGVAQGVGPKFKPQYWKKKKSLSNLPLSTRPAPAIQYPLFTTWQLHWFYLSPICQIF
jgi:hypothetical protein